MDLCKEWEDQDDLIMDFALSNPSCEEEVAVATSCRGRGAQQKPNWDLLQWPEIAVLQCRQCVIESSTSKKSGKGRAQVLRERHLARRLRTPGQKMIQSVSPVPIGNKMNNFDVKTHSSFNDLDKASVSSSDSNHGNTRSVQQNITDFDELSVLRSSDQFSYEFDQDNEQKDEKEEQLCWPANMIAELKRKGKPILPDVSQPLSPYHGTATLYPVQNIQSEYDSLFGFGVRRDQSPNVQSLEEFPSLPGASGAEAAMTSSLPTYKQKDVPVAATSAVTFVHKKKQVNGALTQNSEVKTPFSGLANGILDRENIKRNDLVDYEDSSSSSEEDSSENDRWQTVVGKSERRRNKSSSSSANLTSGSNTIVIENLPLDADLTTLSDLLHSFGKVLRISTNPQNTQQIMKVQYEDPEACEWAVSCLDETDSLFPDCSRPIKCQQI